MKLQLKFFQTLFIIVFICLGLMSCNNGGTLYNTSFIVEQVSINKLPRQFFDSPVDVVKPHYEVFVRVINGKNRDGECLTFSFLTNTNYNVGDTVYLK